MKVKKISMVMQIVIAVLLGIIFGLVFPTITNNFKVVGEIFLRLMQMAIPVLVLGQIVQAVGRISSKELTSFGIRTIVIFACSSILASAWGIIIALFFKPGYGVNIAHLVNNSVAKKEVSLSQTLINFFPKNIIDSLSQGSIIQIIVFGLFFGLALSKFMSYHPDSHVLKTIMDINEIIIDVIKYVMFLAPIGIFSLISSTISSLGIKIILPLLKYLVVYGIGTVLFIMIWMAVIAIYCHVNPLKLALNMKDMSVMALATTSSAITLPIEIEESQKSLGLSTRITNLVLPLGMSLNSNGSAMHMSITVVTIAQMYSLDFSMQKLVYLAIAATFVSLANAVVPGAGLVSLAIIVPQMGLPIESIAIFAGVEWFVGMLRTILNVNSDVYSAILVAKSCNELDYSIFNKTK